MATDIAKKSHRQNQKNPPKSTDGHRQARYDPMWWPSMATDIAKKSHRRNQKRRRKAPTKPKNPPKSTDRHRRHPTGTNKALTLVLHIGFSMFLVEPFFFGFWVEPIFFGFPDPQVAQTPFLTGRTGMTTTQWATNFARGGAGHSALLHFLVEFNI